MTRTARPTGVLVALVALTVASLAGCSSDDDASSATTVGTTPGGSVVTTAVEPDPVTEQLDVEFSEAPGGLTGAVFVADLSCGPSKQSLVDIAVPGTAEEIGTGSPRPLVIHLHGGGFIGGDKSEVWASPGNAMVQQLLDAGVVVASMNYSLLETVDDEGVIKPLHDAARCLQFLRYHGPATFGIDPDRIALEGGSAGAGTALWLATHDDLADPTSTDPVAQQSTKPIAVGAVETQATYDLNRWTTDVFSDYPLFADNDLFSLAEQFGAAQRLLSFYGVSDAAELDSSEIKAYRADVDMLGLMDADDPPAWVSNTLEAEELPLGLGPLFHHPYHARAIERQASEVGYDATVTWGTGATPKQSLLDFLLEELGVDH